MSDSDIYINKATGKEFRLKRAKTVIGDATGFGVRTFEHDYLEPIDDNPMPELKPGYIVSVKVSTDTIEGVVYKVYGKEFNFVCRKFGNDYQQYHIDMVTKIIYQHILIWERKP